MVAASREAVGAAGWDITDLDRIVAHQANAHILLAVRRKLGFPAAKMATNIRHVGNTTAAAIPILLAQDAADGLIESGDRIAVTAFGAGLTWGATTFTWPNIPHPV